MGSMLRSENMTLCDMFLQREAAFEILSRLGEINCVQFLDMNPEVQAFHRNYISEVCRCAEMERRLRYLESEMLKNNMYIPELKGKEPKALQLHEMTLYENVLEKWEDDVLEMEENLTQLRKTYMELAEMYYVLFHIGPMLGETDLEKEDVFTFKSGAGDISGGGHLIVMAGVVQRARCFPFQMMLWRISRGNIYYRQAAQDKIVQDPQTGTEIRKVAFLAVCQGEALSNRMKKVCNGFRVNIYPYPESFSERILLMDKLQEKRFDLQEVLRKTKFHRCMALRTVGKQLHFWTIQVKKAKAIYHTMNLFNWDITKNCLIGQCWVPTRDLKRVQDTLEEISEKIGINVPSFMSKRHAHNMDPPTYHCSNKFTKGFQALINAYGDSKYRELNPGLYTIITFPFLFAIMFGDGGHAIILIAFAVWMVAKENQFIGQQSTNEIWNIFFGDQEIRHGFSILYGVLLTAISATVALFSFTEIKIKGRYVILLLGLFSLYTGFIYNDFFGKPIVLMRSYWPNQHSSDAMENKEFLYLDPSQDTRMPYLFGLDPIWALSKNKIMVQNSVKMKLSIIIGIIHMLFGIVLSFFNHWHFKRYYAIFFQFIPEILFLTCLFVWLVVLIYYKWFTYTSKYPTIIRNAGCAPRILILFIDMFLMSKTKPIEDECLDGYMFPHQRTVQITLVAIALCCVPVLLFGTPVYLNIQNKRKRQEILHGLSGFRRYQQRDSVKKQEEIAKAELANYPPLTDLMIHQGVHTIEFVLSTISHTASYLRLWALSLAHAQLAEMLWDMVFSKLALQDHSKMGALKVFLIFAIWAAFTLSILVVMEGLSAFLHTLRLHWVEFMSKFFEGGGHPFRPFSFAAIIHSESDKSEAACKKRKKLD